MVRISSPTTVPILGARDGRAARGVRAFDEEFISRDVPRPEFWGGYRLTPNRFEFWQHREDRLHDRIVYLSSTKGWTLARQAP
jgi:pyridoxamine 5'-phosphate oxidase